jgi:Peptidase propeptide and YPEB domain
MKHSLISRTCIMKPKDFLRSVILIVALAAFGISSGVASDKIEAKQSSKITKARAERIALTKVPGGSIRSAELETAQGRRFWSVYIAKPRSKNAKEIRVDATSGQILAVQTERPEDQAEEPPKTH